MLINGEPLKPCEVKKLGELISEYNALQSQIKCYELAYNTIRDTGDEGLSEGKKEALISIFNACKKCRDRLAELDKYDVIVSGGNKDV